MSKRICGLFLLLWLAASAFAQQASVIQEIVINGTVNVSKDLILLTMRTKVGQPYIQSQLDQDKKAIEDLGFFSAVDVRAKPGTGQNYQVIVDLVEFPKIKEIRIVGNTVVPTQDILKVLGIEAGQVFNLRSTNPAAAAIRKLYTDRGFFVNIEDFGPSTDSPETLNVVLVELAVASVGVQGNTRTKDRVMKRLIKTRAGEAFSARKWENDLRRIYSTQWFEKVDSIERPAEDVGKVNLIADVKEMRTGIFNIGVQLDPRNSLAGLLKYSDSNFLGTGQTVGINFLQATTGGGASIDLEYGNPFIDGRDTALSVALFSRQVYRFAGSGFGSNSTPTDDDRYTERRNGGTISVSRPFRDNYFGSVGVRFENVKTQNLQTNMNNNFIQQDGDVASIAFAITGNRRDVDLDPSRGDWFRFGVEPGYTNIKKVGGLTSDNSILGHNTFAKITGEYRYYYSPQPPRGRQLDAPRRVFAFRINGGTTTGKLPFFEQYFVGGSNTLRGYAEDRFWGKHYLTSTLEYRHPVQKAFNAILFVDYGGAWGGYGTVNSYTQSKDAKFQMGYGLGFSFRTPLGPIRLDFGWNQSGGSRTHFLIGTSF